MSTIRGLRLLNTIEAGTTSGAQLQTLLGDAGRASEFASVVGTKGNAKRLAANDTSMIAITNSTIALSTVTSNPNTMGELAQSSTAMYKFMSNATARDSFFSSKYQVGKGLDTLILDTDNTTNSTLASQQRIVNVFNDTTATSTVYNSNIAINQIANSTIARGNALAITNSITLFESYPLALAKVIEGQLGGNIIATTNFDTVLNTSGRLTSILADTSLANAVKSAGVVTASKTLAKVAGYNPTQVTGSNTIFSNATIWTTVCGNTATQGFTVESSAIRNTMYNYWTQWRQLHDNAAWDTRWKSYWPWSGSQNILDPYYIAYGYANWVPTGCATFTVSTGAKYLFWIGQPGGSQYTSYFPYFGYYWYSAGNEANANLWYELGYAPQPLTLWPTCIASNATHVVVGWYNGYISWTSESSNGNLNSISQNTSGVMNTYPVYGLAYGNSKWVAVGGGRCAYATIPNGTWSTISGLTTGYAVTYAFNKFIAFTDSRGIYTSTDGVTWTNSTKAYPSTMVYNSYYNQFAYDGTTLFFWTKNDTTLIQTTNGTDWTLVTLPGGATGCYGIFYTGSEFYMVTNLGTFTSTNGSSWTLVTSNAYWASNGRFITGSDRYIGINSYNYKFARNFGFNPNT